MPRSLNILFKTPKRLFPGSLRKIFSVSPKSQGSNIEQSKTHTLSSNIEDANVWASNYMPLLSIFGLVVAAAIVVSVKVELLELRMNDRFKDIDSRLKAVESKIK